ncbi:MAG TPA: hypothetical protein VJ998_00635, partial [Pseudomonadales bacterium]|nr:hypothetical protein [Pseudomonadales bacterium]
MTADNDQLLDAITDVIPKLLASMEAFEQFQRHAHPGSYDELAAFIAPFAAELSTSADGFNDLEFPEDLAPFRDRIARCIEYSLRACDNVARHSEGIGKVMQAMRAQCRAQELLYPLATFMRPVSQYFLEPAARQNDALIQQLNEGASREKPGMHTANNERDSRGG